MGRKPNALILEFFERGAKLNDQSNRYQHTCRRCGEVFPKGRPDSLTRHLFEKCPKITDADRARALWQPAESQGQNNNINQGQHHVQQTINGMGNMSGLDGDMLPFLPNREPSALDTLAEVSRQLQANGLNGAEEAFMAQLQQHIDESDAISVSGHSQPGAAAAASQSASATPPQDDAPGIADESTNFIADGSPEVVVVDMTGDTNDDTDDHIDGIAQVSADVDSAMAHTASSTIHEQIAEAAMQISQSSATPNPASNPTPNSNLNPRQHRGRKRKASSAAGPDPTIPNSYLSYYPQNPPPAVSTQQGHDTTDAENQSVPSRPGRGTSSQPVEQTEEDQSPAFTITQGGFGLLQRANKSKARGRFSEDRRKEVQGVRKKGACLRCRMLKKPCSEGTPCNTCKNIESARLWKQSCIRTRVADEFGLYSTTYFYSKDRANVYPSLNGVDPRNIPGRIEVTLFPDHQLYGTFPALKTNRTGRHTDHLEGLVNSSQNSDADATDMFLLSFKTEDTLALKLERYMSAALMQCIATEKSRIVRATLELAVELSQEHEDELLTKFTHLWTATNILVTNEPLWTIAYNPSDHPVIDHITIVDETTDEGQATTRCPGDGRIYFTPGSSDYDIMHAQLQDAAERYCQKQAKVCLNELERRLLQRQQVPSFLTLLGAVILLNCVERMSALYYSFDPEPVATPLQRTQSENLAQQESDSTVSGVAQAMVDLPDQSASPQQNDDPATEPSIPHDWPLQEPPSWFWPQGARFSSLLQLLLRMRGLPPSIHIRDDGSLAILSNFNKSYPVEVTSSTEGGDSQQVLAAKWIEKTGLSARDLWRANGLSDAEAGENAWGEKGAGASAWDLRYTASLLLPC